MSPWTLDTLSWLFHFNLDISQVVKCFKFLCSKIIVDGGLETEVKSRSGAVGKVLGEMKVFSYRSLGGRLWLWWMDGVKRVLNERETFVEQGRMTMCDRNEWRALVYVWVMTASTTFEGVSHTSSVILRSDQVWRKGRVWIWSGRGKPVFIVGL